MKKDDRDKDKKRARARKLRKELPKRIRRTQQGSLPILHDAIYKRDKFLPAECERGIYLASIRHNFTSYDSVLHEINADSLLVDDKTEIIEEAKRLAQQVAKAIFKDLMTCKLCGYCSDGAEINMCITHMDNNDPEYFKKTCQVLIEKREKERVFTEA